MKSDINGKTLISVIIVTRNRICEVLRAIQSVNDAYALIHDKGLLEILVADNSNREDYSTEFSIRDHFPDVHVIHMNGNKGVTVARNVAAKQAVGEYLLFLDDDAWLSNNALIELVCVRKANSEVFLVTPRIVFVQPDGTVPPKLSPRPKVMVDLYPMEGCMLISRCDFIKLGGFNEYLFFGFEGSDISLRAYYQGKICVQATRAIVYHPSKKTCEQGIKRAQFDIQAKCISAKMTWPVPFSIIRIIKSLIIESIKTAICFRKVSIFFDSMKTSASVLFHKYPRDAHINIARFLEFRRHLIVSQDSLEEYSQGEIRKWAYRD